MSASTLADLFGVGAIMILVVVGFCVVAAATSGTARGRIGDAARRAGLEVAAITATVATVGSLWFSEGAHFTPCELCWEQRIAMYPLVVVLWAAVVYRRRGTPQPGLRVVALVLAVCGLAVNVWHNRIETWPDSGGSCDPFNPCSLRWVEGLGFWTIPRLATVAFSLILLTTAAARPARRETTDVL